MDKRLRHSPASRLVALAFISIILAGNVWLVYFFTAQTVPNWLQYWFSGSITVAMIGGVGLIATYIWQTYVNPQPLGEED